MATPSSATAGFFQAPPPLPNQFHDDAALQRAMHLFLPDRIRKDIEPELSGFGSRVLSPQVFNWVLDAERNPPYVKHFDSWGRRRDDLITSEGWRQLQSLGQVEGMVGIPYENSHQEYSRVHHFLKYALWCGSAAWVNCPTLMVDGVATLFRKHLNDPNLPQDQRKVLREAYERLISRDPNQAWTTGQWMTERQGGSDVSMTETLARYSPDDSLQARAADGNLLGPWLLDGFKWFSSATDANMVVMLARTEKGISTFFAPMKKTLPQADVLGNDTELNGISIQRLKNKLGTRALPTAELVLQGVRAWMIGEEGRGTKEIATVLNIARVHNGVTAIGLWGRALGTVRAFIKVRVVGEKPLWKRTTFMRSVARMHCEYRANVLFNVFVAALLGVIEQQTIAEYKGEAISGNRLGIIPGLSTNAMAEHLFRLLTPALKGHCSKTAISGLQECMECMGGVGYLENDDMQYNIARLYRDANVLPIWEGTTDMMADDSILRVLFGKTKNDVLGSLEEWVSAVMEQLRASRRFQEQLETIEGWWMQFREFIMKASRNEAELKSRAAMDRFVEIIQGLLLLLDATSDGDEIAGLVVEAWFTEKKTGAILDLKAWESRIMGDLKIFFGPDGPVQPAPRL